MILFAIATVGLLSLSCLVATPSFASATSKVSEEISEREQARKAGFKFSPAFYTLHSETFRGQTSVTESKSKEGKMQLNVAWLKVLELKDDVRDNDLLTKAQRLLQSSVVKEVYLGEKLLVSVEFLGDVMPAYKYLINHDADIRECVVAYLTDLSPRPGLPNANAAIERLVALGSHEALKRKIMSIRDGAFGFKYDYKEYQRLLTVHNLTEEDLL